MATQLEFPVCLHDKFTLLRTKEVITPLQKNLLLDVSEIYRPEKVGDTNFRQFVIPDSTEEDDNSIIARVYRLYQNMHTYQTVEFAKQMREKWLKFDHTKMKLMDALETLTALLDESDPDVDVPNIYHGFQTAERIRERHPDEDWFHLVGLIHDMGKVMAIWGESQWAVVGDTFPVGCAPGKNVVFYETSFQNNTDMKDPRYNTKYGMYEPHCGLDKLTMSWGHDEYLYQVLQNHPACTLPEEALYIIRYHSFYPWHTSGDYWHLANEKDNEMFYWVREFNKFDLYSKADDEPDIPELKKYYQSLIDKYIPGEVSF